MNNQDSCFVYNLDSAYNSQSITPQVPPSPKGLLQRLLTKGQQFSFRRPTLTIATAAVAHNPPSQWPQIVDYASLQQPEQALSQFINLIMSVSITVYPLDKVKIGPDTRAVLADKGVTHGIMLRSNLLQLLNADKVKVRFFARQAIAKTIKQVRRYGNSHSVEIINADTINSTVIDSVTSAEGRVYFVVFDKKLPKDGMDNSWFKMTRPDFYTHQPHFMVRAQIDIDGQAFPTLPINDLNALADPKAAPTFSEQDRYWADELDYPLPRPV